MWDWEVRFIVAWEFQTLGNLRNSIEGIKIRGESWFWFDFWKPVEYEVVYPMEMLGKQLQMYSWHRGQGYNSESRLVVMGATEILTEDVDMIEKQGVKKMKGPRLEHCGISVFKS